MRLLILALLLMPGCVVGQARQNPDRDRPNIVLILADDLGYGSLGCYGSTQFHTPHLDALASSGMRFTDFHSNGPMCSPTRAALMTGRYPQRCAWVDDAELSPIYREQRRDNMKQRWAWGISHEELTIAEVLRGSGYETALIGKWHLGYDAKFHPMGQGFEVFRGFISGAVDYHSHIADSGNKELNWWDGREISNEPGYTTDLLTRYVIEFIQQERDKPFFLYLSHAAVHTPLQSRDPQTRQTPLAHYTNMIQSLDESAGQVVEALRQAGIEKNTLVIFCSDNGAIGSVAPGMNSPYRGSKGSLYEGGHRVPMIASWPGSIHAGAVSDSAVMSMDLFPTFAALAGATLPDDHAIDGQNLAPHMTANAPIEPRPLHWVFGDHWAVRVGPWKLMGQGTRVSTLVDVQKSRPEQDNYLNSEPELADRLYALHLAWSSEALTPQEAQLLK